MSVRQDFKGDYMGFTYNNIHSSELGIVRVSDGSRFNENLLPTMQDKTVQVPGGDGTYYFGSYYTQRQFNVSFAFDSLTEQQLATLKSHFGDKKIHDLIFDETPYKVWSAKVTGSATIKYVPFGEGIFNRLYKGEGSIQFTCYYPFARCYSTDPEKYGMERMSDDYEPNKFYYYADAVKCFVIDKNKNPTSQRVYYKDTKVQEVNEWWAASRIGAGINDNFKRNFGDVPVPFILNIGEIQGGTTSITIGKTTISWSNLSEGVLNTKTGLATNSKNEILNEHFDGDLFAKIPVGYATTDSYISFTPEYI